MLLSPRNSRLGYLRIICTAFVNLSHCNIFTWPDNWHHLARVLPALPGFACAALPHMHKLPNLFPIYSLLGSGCRVLVSIFQQLAEFRFWVKLGYLFGWSGAASEFVCSGNKLRTKRTGGGVHTLIYIFLALYRTLLHYTKYASGRNISS